MTPLPGTSAFSVERNAFHLEKTGTDADQKGLEPGVWEGEWVSAWVDLENSHQRCARPPPGDRRESKWRHRTTICDP